MAPKSKENHVAHAGFLSVCPSVTENNYRPISLTCILCKILESIIRDKVMEHFIVKSLIPLH